MEEDTGGIHSVRVGACVCICVCARTYIGAYA